ncbi:MULTISPECIES: dienelactone hydrolase family protein [Gluconobacter]|nr:MULTISPECIES: dienelactone hydrolase family protein [Gluconobacter]MBS0981757.1 dienelactone hydrolase family protein [Gluconobacter cerinus]MBS0993732.1 dienelactone hydrolase family protein [Gluconobacter cerinus]MBS1017871.1 dienelactone hydrolase family protein [Gluconobacter cerinus]MBS1021029.1 dienelactone hydrolase family protein [Gluconobacter cerinus]MBS1036592.1 dienelactone hydrolase family protein [Gluconobacter cerinus]
MDHKHSQEKTEGHMIRLTAADGHEFEAWETGSPESTRSIVVVQEIFGLTGHIRDVCSDLAQQGFHVLAPALFDRVKPHTVLAYNEAGLKEGLEFRSGISPDLIQQDLEACAQKLRQDDGHRPVGIIGFCWGGLIAWLAATRTHHFNAAVGWYGGGIANHCDTAPHCPTQLHFGGEDASIPPGDVQKIRASRPEVEVFLYDQAGHGFGCPERSSFNQDARDLAWSRSVAFLKHHIKRA